MHVPKVELIPGRNSNHCTLQFTDAFGNTYGRDFGAPAGGGYVYENLNNPRQVCGGLRRIGTTLIWDPEEYATLSDLIWREAVRAWAAANFALGLR